MRTHTSTLNLKSLHSHQSAKPDTFLIPETKLQEKPVQFAPALAHEIRNPLTTINLAVQILRSPVKVHDTGHYLDIIAHASGEINDLITDLFRSQQPDKMQSGQYSVHQLLDEALAMTKDRIFLKNIAVRKDYTTLDCKIWVNKLKIKIALTNIIINAIEAMPPVKGKLKLITRSINGNCVIEIQDNGVGISKANLKNIFTPYFTDKPAGMGLGLSTTIDILNSNHVKTEVGSKEGKGTRFILTFEKTQQSGECL